ncbi:MAG: TRIC cation channel family protein [Dehalococcoidia bacterium]|nr:TRIC cation channel family protein [Dehalococcoidia bacterium]
MEFASGTLVGALDRAGIVAFALSGVEVGARKQLDAFGLLVMGVVTATGGGLMRDVVIGRVPFVLAREDYLLWAVLASAAAIAVVWGQRRIPRLLVAVADALGLGAFAAAGALAGITAGLSLPAVLVLAVLTGTGGGVLRDLLADRVPLVLRSEINATAALLGGLALWTVEPLSNSAAALTGLAVGAVVRVTGVAFDLHLPAPGRRRGEGPREE